jgi:hypothetical protein
MEIVSVDDLIILCLADAVFGQQNDIKIQVHLKLARGTNPSRLYRLWQNRSNSARRAEALCVVVRTNARVSCTPDNGVTQAHVCLRHKSPARNQAFSGRHEVDLLLY